MDHRCSTHLCLATAWAESPCVQGPPGSLCWKQAASKKLGNDLGGDNGMWFGIQKSWELAPNPLAAEPFPSSLTWSHLQGCWADCTGMYMSFPVQPSCWETWLQEPSSSPWKGCLSIHFLSRVVKVWTGPSRMGLLLSSSPRRGKHRREQLLCLKMVLVNSSPEHLPNGTMTKGIGRKRQLRETDG